MNDLFNFRDLAGMPTSCQRKIRPGRVFRTGNISYVSPETGKTLVKDYNIKTYVDFRVESEIKAFGRPEALIASGAKWVNLQIDTDDKMFIETRKPGVSDWTGLYTRLFEKNRKTWVQFLNLVLEAEDAIIYGCVFGKDRTGIATSFLLTTLDVHDDHISSDYAHTTKAMIPDNYNRYAIFWDNSDLTPEEHHSHYLTAHPEVMREFMTYIRQHLKEFAQMLEEAGWNDTKAELLKKKLLI